MTIPTESAKVAWITGGGSGIGATVALKLAQAGWQVAISGRNPDKLQLVADRHQNIAAFPLDVTDAAATETIVAALFAKYRRLDLALLNAGDYLPFGVADWDGTKFRQMIEVNLMGPVNGLSALLPRLQSLSGGHIALVASVAGYAGLPNAAAYSASKAGLIALAESIRPECEHLNIKLQLVCPGFVATPLTAQNRFAMPMIITADQAADALIAGLATNRFEITMPRRFALIMKLLRALPYPLFFAITRRILKRDEANPKT
jgi:NAD(P)-dependent dehydrogenase (short-subunit alcohol dehydrogenase family)